MLTLIRQHPIITLIGVLLLASLIWGFLPKPISITVTETKRATLTVSIEEEGRTRLIDRYVITAPIDGTACRTDFEVGDSVFQGQELLHISPLTSPALDARSRARAEAQIAAAESTLQAAEQVSAAAETSAELTAIELQRLEKLIANDLVSMEQYDRAKAEDNRANAALRSAKFNIDVANHELEAAKALLDYSSGASDEDSGQSVPILSPISGKVLRVASDCARAVQTGEWLLEVGDPSALEVEVDVLSADAVKIKPGMRVLFDHWGGEKPLEGIVRIVEPIAFTKVSALGVEEQRVLIISDFVSTNELWKNLGDGYRVAARFVLWHQDEVLQVPASSLFRYKDGWALFVLEDNRAKRRKVSVGQRNSWAAQILEGIKVGDQVINYPDDKIEDGNKVKLIDHTRE